MVINTTTCSAIVWRRRLERYLRKCAKSLRLCWTELREVEPFKVHFAHLELLKSREQKALKPHVKRELKPILEDNTRLRLEISLLQSKLSLAKVRISSLQSDLSASLTELKIAEKAKEDLAHRASVEDAVKSAIATAGAVGTVVLDEISDLIRDFGQQGEGPQNRKILKAFKARLPDQVGSLIRSFKLTPRGRKKADTLYKKVMGGHLSITFSNF